MRDYTSILAWLRSRMRRDEIISCFYCRSFSKDHDILEMIAHEKKCRRKIEQVLSETKLKRKVA